MEPLPAPSDRPPLLLALSVHWDDCSVALGTGDTAESEVWSQQPERGLQGAHLSTATGRLGGSQSGPLASRDALLLLDRLLVRTDTPLSAVDCLCFARGPGAFTSLRVAAGLMQGLSLATSKPVAGICSLAAMAAHEPGWGKGLRWLQLSAIDARMDECYYGLHECQGGHYPQPLVAPAVGRADRAIAVFDQVLAQRKAHDSTMAVTLAGNAFLQSPELAAWARDAGFDAEAAAGRAPDAAVVLAVAASVGAPPGGPPELALPVYVRDKIALDRDEQLAQAAARK